MADYKLIVSGSGFTVQRLRSRDSAHCIDQDPEHRGPALGNGLTNKAMVVPFWDELFRGFPTLNVEP